LCAADPFTGIWILDLSTSTFADDNPMPRELTLMFTAEGGNRTQVLKGIAADGSATSTAWTSPISGGTVTFPAGQGPNGGASVTVVDDNTLLMTQNHPNGKAGASRTYTVSADGKILTLTQRRENGQERAKMVFGRP
jgi:hypothetical protein